MDAHWLIVGLGNPGREYAGTRHNIGFEVVDRLAEKLGWVKTGEFDRMARMKFDGLALDGPVSESEKLLLLKPVTYMNLSGRAVQAAITTDEPSAAILARAQQAASALNLNDQA